MSPNKEVWVLHMAGYGWIHSKPEFLPEWDNRKIMDALVQVVRRCRGEIQAEDGGRADADVTVGGVSCRVAVACATSSRGGKHISSFFPVVDGR